MGSSRTSSFARGWLIDSADRRYHGTDSRANYRGELEAGDVDRSPDSRCFEIRLVAK